MLFDSRPAGAVLAPFVEYFWSLSDAPLHARERVVPTGTFELVINLHEDRFTIFDAGNLACRRFSGAIVSGAYGEPFVIDTRQHASIVGVHFRPGGAFPFLGTSAGAVGGAHVDLESFWGRDARELRERLCEVASAEARFQLLEAYLVDHLRRQHAQRGAVRAALCSLRGDGRNIAAIADAVGLSHRRFIQVFVEQVGMTPKRFDRIQRFQRAVSQVGRSRAPSWTQLALDCGYYDHPHLLRDFAAFSGVTPTEYRKRQRDLKASHAALPQDAPR